MGDVSYHCVLAYQCLILTTTIQQAQPASLSASSSLPGGLLGLVSIGCSLVPCSLVALCTGLVHSLYPLDVHCGVCTHVCFCLQNILISSWKTYNKERGGGFCVCIVLGTVEETETKDKPHVPLCRRQKNEHDHSLCCSAQANMCSAQANMFRGYKLWIRL